MVGPMNGLFPKINNLDQRLRQDGCDDSTSNQSTPVSNDKEHEMLSSDSIETAILNEIIQEDYTPDSSRFKENMGAQRFYLSQLFNKKAGLPDVDTEVTDFVGYNNHVEHEYKLRDKMEKILSEGLEEKKVSVLDDELLQKTYIGGDEINIKNYAYSSAQNIFKYIRKPKPLRISRFQRKNDTSFFHDSNSSSGDTRVIDFEKHGEWAVNDKMIKKNGNKLEAWISFPVTSRSTGTLSKLSKCFRFLRLRKSNYSVQRKLDARHIQMIATGASFGVGVFLSSGKSFTIAGPFGTLLGFFLCGSIVMSTLLSFTELCALIPLTSGFSGLASRFVEDAFGFALGWLYWFSFIIALPSQLVASASFLSYFEALNIDGSKLAGSVTVFLAYAVIMNIFDVRVFAEFIYVATLFKIIFCIVMIFVMIILNSGGSHLGYDRVGFRFWDATKSTSELTYGLFRPTFDLKDDGNGATSGISGSKGRIFAVFLSMLIASFSYSGMEMTFVASCEVKNPNKTLPSAMKRTVYTILILYLISILVVGISMYSGDPNLPRFYTYAENNLEYNILNGIGTSWQVTDRCPLHFSGTEAQQTIGDRSPWVIALSSFGWCTFASAFNGILIFFGTTGGCSSLYGASRTLYAMAVQRKAPSVFEICTSYGVPWVSVVFSGVFGAISYVAVDSTSLNNFQILANIASGTICIIWAGMNFSFLRFFYALKKRPDIISRDDSMFPYKSPLQPYLSIYGLIGSLIMVFFAGFTSFFHGFWATEIFFSCYGGLIFFIVCYTGYKLIGTSKFQRLDQLDMDTGRREIDRTIWKEHKEYDGNWREKMSSLVTWLY